MDRLPRRMTVVIPIVLAMLNMIGPLMIDTPFPEMARDHRVGFEEMQPSSRRTSSSWRP